MFFLSVEKIRQAEKKAMENASSIQLINNAAACVYENIKDFNSVRIYCGKGNNGSDGYATALLLAENNKKVEIVSVLPPEGEECVYFYEKAVRMGIPITDKIEFSIEEFDCYVDAIFGIGFKGEVDTHIKKAIDMINAQDSYVVSIDIPSGMNADAGEGEISVRADKTVTFTAPKMGMLSNKSVDLCGEIVVCDVGIGTDFEENEAGIIPITKRLAKTLLPKRARLTHKGSFGTLVIIAGSKFMAGAAAMAAQAAYKSGCGLVKIIAPESISGVLNILVKEAVVVGVPSENGYIGQLNEKAKEEIKKADAILVGCGLGTGASYGLISNILSISSSGVIIDADAINALSGHLDIIKNQNVMLTPHPLEFSRITNLTVEEIEKRRIHYATRFAQSEGVSLLLKGARSIVSYGGENKYVSLFSTSALSKAGSGDVLAGIIGAFTAQGLSLTDSGVLATFIHGSAGMIAEKRIGAFGTTASDIIELIPEVIRAIK